MEKNNRMTLGEVRLAQANSKKAQKEINKIVCKMLKPIMKRTLQILKDKQWMSSNEKRK